MGHDENKWYGFGDNDGQDTQKEYALSFSGSRDDTVNIIESPLGSTTVEDDVVIVRIPTTLSGTVFQPKHVKSQTEIGNLDAYGEMYEPQNVYKLSYLSI